jgi:hypothetical protein
LRAVLLAVIVAGGLFGVPPAPLAADECPEGQSIECDCEDAGWTWIAHYWGCGGSPHVMEFADDEDDCNDELQDMGCPGV